MIVAVGSFLTVLVVAVVAAAIADGARFAFFVGGLIVGGFVFAAAIVMFWSWVAEAVA